MNIEIKYNPYYMRTSIKVNGEDISGNNMYKKVNDRIDAHIPLMSWIDKSFSDPTWEGLLEEMVQESGEVNICISFDGRKVDFVDLQETLKNQNKRLGDKYCLEFNEPVISLDDQRLSVDIRYIVNKMLSPEFAKIVTDAENRTEQLVEKYNSLKDDYERLTNKEFKIIFSGLMSSGKSTLINSIIGKRILPTADDTCTSRILKIKHNGKIGDKVVLRCRDVDDNIVVKKEVFTEDADVMERLKEICPGDGSFMTQPPEVETIEIEMNLSHLYPNKEYEEQFTVVIVDTPGTDSGVGNRITTGKTHEEITMDAICDHEKEMVVFVVDGTKYEDDGVSDFLDLIERESEKAENIGFNDRFLFLLNKCDDKNYNDDECLEDTIEGFSDYLCRSTDGHIREILSPRIFPVCAEVALAIKKGVVDKKQPTNELKNLYRTYKEFAEKCTDEDNGYSRNYHLELCAALSDYQKNELGETVERGEEITEILLHTGIPSLEFAIKSYIERYAYPIKVNALLNTFESILSQLREVIISHEKRIVARIDEIGKVKERKKEEEKGKAGEIEEKKQLEQLELNIEGLLVEIKSINANQKLISDLQASQDKTFFNAKVKAITQENNKKYNTREEAERIIKSAYDVIQNAIVTIKKKATEIEDDAIKKGNDIASRFKRITEKISESLPPTEKDWFDNSVAKKELLNFENLSDLLEKINRHEHSYNKRNPIKDETYSWWQIGKKIKKFFAPETILVREESYSIERIKDILESLNVEMTNYIVSLKEQLNSINDMKEYIRKSVSVVKSEIHKHLENVAEFDKKIKQNETDEKKIEEIKKELLNSKTLVEDLCNRIENVVMDF